jgi:hypothetical protein
MMNSAHKIRNDRVGTGASLSLSRCSSRSSCAALKLDGCAAHTMAPMNSAHTAAMRVTLGSDHPDTGARELWSWHMPTGTNSIDIANACT